MPASSSATSSSRSPRATPSATWRQKARARSGVSGCMKLTEAPPSTQSMSTSASAFSSASVTEERARRRGVAVAVMVISGWMREKARW
ncbi:hypothetical protein D9M69_488070 [compost metagenome]